MTLTLGAVVVTEPSLSAERPERSQQDRPDIVGNPQVHVIYFVPKDAPDRRLDLNGTISRGMAGLQEWFARQTGGYQWRLDLVGSPPQLDVTFVRGHLTTEEYTFSKDIEDEVTGRGFAKAEKKYLVLFDGLAEDSGLCGLARTSYHPYQPGGPRADRLTIYSGGPYALVFLNADSCKLDWGTIERPGRAQATAMHELLHSVSMVPPTALHHCTGIGGPGHICGHPFTGLVPFQEVAALDPERLDVMFPAIMGPLHELTLDRGNDDYFCTLVGANDPGVTYDLATSDWVVAPDGHACGDAR